MNVRSNAQGALTIDERKQLIMQYTAKITKRGQITIPAEIRKERNWSEGSRLIFSVNSENNIEIHKEVNLYDTEWGNYDFKKAVAEDPELQMSNFTQGREGWPENE